MPIFDPTLPNPNEQRIKINKRFDSDFRFYAKYHLKIRTKSGDIQPFIFNHAQDMLDAFIAKQINDMGKVRILILKARQQGFSTYTGGRFYWRTTRNPGKATFILSHEAGTTEKLFAIVERYHANCPEAARIDTDVANRRRMVFADIGSEYFVGTAGNDNVGRGGTIQYLHASEAAFYPPGDGFSKGLLQSVPDLPGTEVVLESTANGMDPLFYRMCMDALNGKGEYRLFFSPWFWQKEYRKELPLDFMPTQKEAELAELHKLDWEQIYWRRMQIEGPFKGDEKSFMQEYPATVEEAFVSSGESLIDSFKINQARKSLIKDDQAPLVIGIDTNESKGRTGVCFRRGRVMEKAYAITKVKAMELVGEIANLINVHDPVKVFLDVGNGYGVIDRLQELGYGDIVQGVSFNEGAIEETQYLNKRVEMWDEMRKWFDEAPNVRCPDSDVFHKELACVPPKKKTSSGLQKLESKEIIIQDTGVCPDIGDAAALTFAYPVRREANQARKMRKVERGKSPLKSVRRRNELGNSSSFASNKVDFGG